MSGVKGIATALAKAQLQMGKAKEKSSNPHFKSKYANLASVMDACMEALNSNGIAVIQPIETETENGLSVTTVFIHGESGESLHNHVPLVVSKNDMQGYGSAITYARRYGLMMMAAGGCCLLHVVVLGCWLVAGCCCQLLAANDVSWLLPLVGVPAAGGS